MTRRRPRKTEYFALAGLVALILVSGLISLQPYGSPINWITRGAALLGYLAIFLAIVSSAYLRQLVRFFGRPFVQVHHILSVTGLILITLHPLSVAWSSMSLGVLLPRFDSWRVFLQLGGRPAWYLIAAAALAAALRGVIGQRWRAIHLLNYAAFLLGTVHAILIGTDFQQPFIKAVAIIMAIVVVATLIQKRLQRGRR
jgi:DMSO/TMAO reductase YedYZ heme-binding membrane subunit